VEIEPEGWKNPVRKVKAPKTAIEPLEPASIEDVEKIIKVCGKDVIGRRNKSMLYFLMDTGTRASEMLGVRLTEIDLITGEVLIKSGKGRKPGYVFLGEKSRRSLRQYLKLRHDNSPFLWVTSSGDGGLSYWGLVSEIKRLSVKAKVKTPSIHSFRRLWSLQMLNNGKTDILSISRLGGWTSLQMLQRYAKQNSADLKAKSSSPVDDRGLR
jgi:integrase/recombinase XerD